MRKTVANPIELRDAIRCEKKKIALTSGFANMMRPFAEFQQRNKKEVNISEVTEAVDLPASVVLAFDSKTMAKLFKTYQVVVNEDTARGVELEYVHV
ncbi:hypothetical protein [Candidatus Enterococcus ferrettii]|uniref:Uncharacterized protein n=1 Tax=Candidatus Enterococcus ferrettii TaxID=2815324 RepID=A0ABV0ES44_9ENTE|nr:hypothetical protein [Enterococcus sp. 665A]MBO1340396.1 hypothetical protein [Enterococcus sp. 665A]